MQGDYELWAPLRRPLPGWWISDGGRDSDYPVARGLAFVIRRESGHEWRCTVARRLLSALAGEPQIQDLQVEQAWREHGYRFMAAAKRKIAADRPAPGRAVEIGLVDLNWD